MVSDNVVNFPTVRRVFGLQIDALSLDQSVQRCASAIRTRSRLMIGVLNASKVVHLRSDFVLRESLLECDMLLADGQSVVWASRLLKQPLVERVAGCDLFESLLALADQEGHSVFLLGATAEVLEKLRIVVADRYPGARIVGSRDGYFGAADSEQVATQIRLSGADMLFLGMTSPKKEIFLGTWGPSLNVPVLHGVGGSFDVVAGVTKRAPLRWQRMGLEWAYRTLQEPGRMWRRYLTTNTRFILLLAREMIHATPLYPLPRNAATVSLTVQIPAPRGDSIAASSESVAGAS